MKKNSHFFVPLWQLGYEDLFKKGRYEQTVRHIIYQIKVADCIRNWNDCYVIVNYKVKSKNDYLI